MDGQRYRDVVAVVAACLAVIGCGGGQRQDQPLSVAENTAAAVPTSGVDPLIQRQWYLYGVDAGVQGANVLEAWQRGALGQGTVVAIVDDGIESTHEDLAAGLLSGGSHNYGDGSVDPTPPPGSAQLHFAHGTAVAGIVGARSDNGLGISGVAPGAGLVGYNATLLTNATDVNLANAMLRGGDVVDVSNNSWSKDPDGTGQFYPAGELWESAVETGTRIGREGKGVIYVWAAGNGGTQGVDNANYDGLASNRHVIAVCAVGVDGRSAAYSEDGANLWVCAPSWGGDAGDEAIVTTDRSGNDGFNQAQSQFDVEDPNYTSRFGGTSAAAPIVSGVTALMLDVNPDLTWRDVRYILALTATQNDPSHADWVPNGADPPLWINHEYGFGLVNAGAAVTRASRWKNLPPQRHLRSGRLEGRASIPDGDPDGVWLYTQVYEDMTVEWTDVVVHLDSHPDPGDLTITLYSPSGTHSVLAQSHPCPGAGACTPVEKWRFGTARNLAESARGTWALHIVDGRAGGAGAVRAWELNAYGH